jgi:hypothetical protein
MYSRLAVTSVAIREMSTRRTDPRRENNAMTNGAVP